MIYAFDTISLTYDAKMCIITFTALLFLITCAMMVASSFIIAVIAPNEDGIFSLNLAQPNKPIIFSQLHKIK